MKKSAPTPTIDVELALGKRGSFMWEQKKRERFDQLRARKDALTEAEQGYDQAVRIFEQLVA